MQRNPSLGRERSTTKGEITPFLSRDYFKLYNELKSFLKNNNNNKIKMTKTGLTRFLNSLNKLDDRKKDLRSKSKLSIYLDGVLKGLLLSDGHLERSSHTSAVRLSVSFGYKHSKYLTYLYELFEPYTNTKPVSINVHNKRTNTNHDIIKFNTASLPLLIHYHEMFYKANENGKYIKIIPLNIEDSITPVLLAHLIMGDGNLKSGDKILRIYTNSFTQTEVELLAKGITDKLNIKARAAHDRNNQYMITISKTELPLIQNLVLPHMHPSMLYKIDLDEVTVKNEYKLVDHHLD